MNVLLVTYSFPPAAGVGVLRALSLAKYLPENGIRLDVLTTRNAAAVGHDARPLAQLSAGVTIHRTWTPDLPFGLRKALKTIVSRTRSASNAPARSPGNANANAAPNPLKQFLANLLLPDPQLGWVPFALHAARSIVRKRKIDLVLLTVPPFSSVRVVTRLRRLFPVLPIVLDFRDEWLTSTIDLVSFNNNQRARVVAHKAESEAVRDASAVVCVTEAAVAELRKRYPEQPAAKFHCIPNGFDTAHSSAATPRAAPAADAQVTLTYIGSVYGSTDPAPLVEAVLSLPDDIRSRLRLRFIGHIETPALRSTLQRLEPAVALELIGFLPQAQALAYIAETDYLLLITHDAINVAAKLYDYIGSGRPILAAVHPTGDVRRILDRTRAGWSASIASPAAIAQMLTDAVHRAPELAGHFLPDREAIAAYHRRPLTARYAELLRTLAPNARPADPHLDEPAPRSRS
ncbi:MAG: glycosyltransferase [Acidobacteriota bacterium]|nr:glycosyltransferase [Acidobacteriota bacterium]